MSEIILKGGEKLERLAKQLKSVPKRVASKVVRTGMRTAAKKIQQDAKLLSPTDSGELKRSIKVRSAKRKKDRIRIQVSSISDARNLAMEFGTKHVKAQPFLEPAADKNTTLALNILADSIEQSLIEIFRS